MNTGIGMLPRRRLRGWGATWAVISLAAGCGTSTVEVGEAMVRLDLASCYGTRCTESDLEPRVIAKPPEASCAAGPPRMLAWSTVVSASAFALAPDDTLWVSTVPQSSHIALQRFDVRGEIVAPVAIDLTGGAASVQVEATALAPTASGHAFVGLTLEVAEHEGWDPHPKHLLLEVDERCELVGDPIELEGIRDKVAVAIGADGALLVSAVGEAGLAVLGRLDEDRRVRWIQTATRQATLHQLYGDARGQTLVFGRTATTLPFEHDDSVALYDDRGELLWDVRPGTVHGLFAPHADGSAVIVGHGPEPEYMPMVPNYGDIYAAKVDRAGREQWSLRFPASDYVMPRQGAGAVDRDDNTYFVHGDMAYRLDPEGSCEARAVEDGLQGSALMVTSTGVTFVVADFIAGAFEP